MANRKAAPEAEKTDRFSGALMPRAKVIERANKSRSQPLKKAATRVNTPRTSATPNRVSAQVAAPSQSWNRCGWYERIKFPGVCHEMQEVSPRHVGLSKASPEAEPICHRRKKRDPKGEPQEYGTVVFHLLKSDPLRFPIALNRYFRGRFRVADNPPSSRCDQAAVSQLIGSSRQA